MPNLFFLLNPSWKKLEMCLGMAMRLLRTYTRRLARFFPTFGCKHDLVDACTQLKHYYLQPHDHALCISKHLPFSY